MTIRMGSGGALCGLPSATIASCSSPRVRESSGRKVATSGPITPAATTAAICGDAQFGAAAWSVSGGSVTSASADAASASAASPQTTIPVSLDPMVCPIGRRRGPP